MFIKAHLSSAKARSAQVVLPRFRVLKYPKRINKEQKNAILEKQSTDGK